MMKKTLIFPRCLLMKWDARTHRTFWNSKNLHKKPAGKQKFTYGRLRHLLLPVPVSPQPKNNCVKKPWRPNAAWSGAERTGDQCIRIVYAAKRVKLVFAACSNVSHYIKPRKDSTRTMIPNCLPVWEDAFAESGKGGCQIRKRGAPPIHGRLNEQNPTFGYLTRDSSGSA